MAAPQILITGAAGYIGGTILSTLLESKTIPKGSISVISRGEDKLETFKKLGVNVVLFNNLDESDLLRRVASEHDVVIHTASGFHTGSANALILGLGDRKKQTGREVHYIHTSGTSNLADQPITGKYLEDRIFSDKDNKYAYEKSREALQIYSQRTTDIVVVETGLEAGVQTHIIMSPTIYGVGTGLFNKLSIQVPALIRAALKAGQAQVIGEGKAIWDYVHIKDLANLYQLLVTKIIAGEQIPSGEKGIIFSATGRYSWIELSQGVANALFALKAIETSDVHSIDISTASEMLGGLALLNTELGFASNSRTQSDVSRELGWKPQKTKQDFNNDFLEEAKLVIG